MAYKKKSSGHKADKYAITAEDSVKRTVLSAVIILGILALFGTLAWRFVDMQLAPEYEPKDVWAEAFANVENNRVGIVFNSIGTTDDEYEQLRTACNQYIESYTTPNPIDANLDVDIAVGEKSYVDSGLTESGEDESSPDSYIASDDVPLNTGVQREDAGAAKPNPLGQVETGPIYLEEMLMIRYINNDGLMSVVTGAFDKDKNIKVLTQPELQQFYYETYTPNEESDTEESEDSPEATNSRVISEEEYLNEVSDCISKLLLAQSNVDEQAAMNSALNYFTTDGKDSVLASRQLLAIDGNTVIELAFGLCGKSSTSQVVKDRVYLQYNINNGAETSRVNIIVKLNSNLRIFDIDVI